MAMTLHGDGKREGWKDNSGGKSLSFRDNVKSSGVLNRKETYSMSDFLKDRSNCCE